MKSNEILYSGGKNDECLTPDYGVTPILKYIPKGAVVWCPFDTEDSEFVKKISKQNSVIYSHIDYGEDFFNHAPHRDWDIIISNPPFTDKRKFFERALDLGKPFALLMTLAMMNDKYPFWSFYERGRQPQLLKFDKRVEFGNSKGNGKITFQSGYICCDFLPKDIIMEELNK